MVSGPRRVKGSSCNRIAVGLQLVGQYYTVWYNALKHVWRFYAENANYCRKLLEKAAAPEISHFRLGSETADRWSSSRWRRSGARPISCW